MQGERDVTEMLYPTSVSAFVYKKNHQIATKYSSILFNNQVKALRHDVHICTFRKFMLASLMNNNEDMKLLEGEANMMKVTLLKSADFLY